MLAPADSFKARTSPYFTRRAMTSSRCFRCSTAHAFLTLIWAPQPVHSLGTATGYSLTIVVLASRHIALGQWHLVAFTHFPSGLRSCGLCRRLDRLVVFGRVSCAPLLLGLSCLHHRPPVPVPRSPTFGASFPFLRCSSAVPGCALRFKPRTPGLGYPP